MKTKHLVTTALVLTALFFWPLAAQSQSPLDDSLIILDKLMSSLKVSSIIGEPIRAGNSIIIPFSRIKFGLGAGGSMQAIGAGMGGKAIPEGLLIIEGEDVRVELFPVEEKKPSFLQEMLPVLLKMLPQMMGGKFPTPGAPSAGTQPKSEKPSEPSKETSLSQVEKFFKEEKYSEALDMTDSLLAKDPNNAELHAWKGSVMGNLATGNPLNMMKYGMGAMQEFETALKIDPDNIRAHFGRGIGRLKAPEGFGRDYDGAIEDFSFVCEKKPSPEAFYNLGVACQGKGLMDKAKEAFKKALSLKPDYAEAAKALAEIK